MRDPATEKLNPNPRWAVRNTEWSIVAGSEIGLSQYHAAFGGNRLLLAGEGTNHPEEPRVSYFTPGNSNVRLNTLSHSI